MLGVIIIRIQVLPDPEWRHLFDDFAPWVLQRGLSRCFMLPCGRIGEVYRHGHGDACLFPSSETPERDADLPTCKFCKRHPNSRSNGEPWERRYAQANPWKEGERTAFIDMRRMFRNTHTAAEFGRTQSFAHLLQLYPHRRQQPRADFVPRAELLAALQERDDARRDRDAAKAQLAVACRERDSATAKLAELVASLRSLLASATPISLHHDRSRSPRVPRRI